MTRTRKFNPRKFFLSVLHLAAGTNNEGYNFALQKSWQLEEQNFCETPVKSSLSEIRDKVSYKFFEDIWKNDLARLNSSRKTFRGFFVYSVDGDELFLPASSDILSNGFRGHQSRDKETHYPKMYSVHAFDVVNHLVCRFVYDTLLNAEHDLARDLVPTLEPNSIAIYDRYHCAHATFKAHEKAGNYFIIRAKIAGLKTPIPLQRFVASNRLDEEVDWYPREQAKRRPSVPMQLLKLKLRVVKIRNPKTKTLMVFVTNLKKETFSRQEIGQLYLKRWEVETSFKDLTDTFKLDQWHSRKLNGVLQEIYALLWMINAIKSQLDGLGNKTENLLDMDYKRANFKLCAHIVLHNLDLLITGQRDLLLAQLSYWFNRTLEKRKRLSRPSPRAVRRWHKRYWSLSMVKRRK